MNFFISSESGETCAGQAHLEVKTVLNSKCWWILMWEDNIGTDKALLWIMDLYFDQKRRFKVKMPSRWICCLQRHFTSLFTSQDINWWTLVDYSWIIVMFLSADAHSDGTHSLQRIHWWARDVMLHFSKSVLMKKQPHLPLGWPEQE